MSSENAKKHMEKDRKEVVQLFYFIWIFFLVIEYSFDAHHLA